MKYYYMINGKIMSANEKMPQGEDYVSLNPTHFNKLDFDIDAKQWLNSLQPCKISESELEKVKYYVFTYFENQKEPIEVTDIVEEKSIRELENKYKNQSSGTVGFAADYVYKDYIFFRQPKQVEETWEDIIKLASKNAPKSWDLGDVFNWIKCYYHPPKKK